MTFSDGTQIPVGALPNDGTGLTVNVPNITTTTLTLTVNTVSSTTQNVGLAEIEAWTPVGGGNQSPTANAGPAQTVATGATVTLDGSGSSDPNNNSLTYQWTADGRASGDPVRPDGGQADVHRPGHSSYPDLPAGGEQRDAQQRPQQCHNHRDRRGPAGRERGCRADRGHWGDGDAGRLGSSDPNNNPLTYQWTQTGGPAVTLSDPTAVKPTFTAPATAATLTFQLVVNNGTLSSAPSSVTITVTPGNQPPVASAGAAQTVATGATVTLDGSGSSDPNNNSLTYQWTQTGGPAVTLSDPTAVKPTFTAPATAATLTFQLVVNNGTLSSAPSSVGITVTPDVAMLATATALSQNTATGQTAAKAIDGVVDGYPG